MTTKKQIAANQANAAKSTGAKTPEGKAVVSMNAIRHGILSQRLFLDSEDPADFAALQKGLVAALKPVGVLEMALVEKIGVALWKQRRMVSAETATIELDRRLDRRIVRQSIAQAMGNYDLEDGDLDELEVDQVKWCEGVLAEYPAAAIASDDLAALKKAAPLIFEQILEEAEEESSIPQYVIERGGLSRWMAELSTWCTKELAQQNKRPVVQAIANLVLTGRSAPIGNELLIRYQVALDGELYRAMEALRRQQEWRIRSGINIEVEEAVEA